MRNATIFLGALLLAANTFDTKTAVADTFVSADFSGTDCGGLFSVGGAEICNVTNGEPDVSGGLKRFSPLIYQRFSDGLELHSSLYPTIDNSEFAFTGLAGNSGFFSYDPGTGDPDVKFWAAQGDSSFRLRWIVADADASLCASGSELSSACLSAAIGIPAGTILAWQVPAVGNTVSDVAHLSFYGTPSIGAVPLPAALPLLASGLGGLGLMGWWRRRRREQAAAP